CDDQGSVVYVRRTGNAMWHVLTTLPGGIQSVAARGGDLAALTDSGDWMLFWEGGGVVGQPLPKFNQVLALAGDEQGLGALGKYTGGAPSTTQDSGATSAPATTQSGPQWIVYRSENGAWKEIADLPEALRPDSPAQVSMILSMRWPMVATRDTRG